MEFDFSTNSTVDSLDTVPESFRGAYEEKDGKFSISPAATGLVTAITGLTGALKKERQTTKDLKGKPDASAALRELFGDEVLGDDGVTVDPEKAKAILAGLNQTIAEKAKVDPAKIRQDIEKTFATERQGLQDANKRMQSTLERYLVESEANRELAGAKGNPVLLLPHVKSQARVVEDNGEYVVRVLDADGQYRGDGKGGYMGVKDLVAEMRGSSDFAAAFESDKGSGTQQQHRPAPAGGAAVRGAHQQQQREARSPVDKIAAGLAARQAAGQG